MKHFELLTFCCQQAERDLQTGHGVGYSADPVDVLVQPFPSIDEAGCYRVMALANNHVGPLLCPNDEFLARLHEHPQNVEGYISTIRDNAWKYAHSDEVRCLALAANQEPIAE